MANLNEETKLVINQHYDESLEVNDAEEVASLYSPTPRKTPTALPPPDHLINRGEPRMSSQQSLSEDVSLNDEFDLPERSESNTEKPRNIKPSNMNPGQPGFSDGDSEDSDSTSDEDDEDDNAGELDGAYDPADYEHLTVSQEIKELFQYITRYTPQTIELEHKLKPFNPDYIPAVGDIDAFLKVPRPDNKAVSLGLTVLDEPCANQSDPTVLDLQLRSISKTTGVRAMQVRSVKDVEKNPKAIDTWVESMEELHRSKPPQNVHYSKGMPDIDDLMEQWPPEVEDMIKNLNLPTAELDCNLQNYIDIICGLLDIPVHNSRIQSLHVLFSLYSAFKQMQHFQTDTTEPEGEDMNNEPEVLNFE